jgi:hypothetical protein
VELVPWNRFLGSLNVYKYGQATLASGIGSLELIPGLLKRLQTRAQATMASGIFSLESIPRLRNMKNEDEDVFFWDQNEYIRLPTIKGM